jgi:hypothetical protein
MSVYPGRTALGRARIVLLRCLLTGCTRQKIESDEVRDHQLGHVDDWDRVSHRPSSVAGMTGCWALEAAPNSPAGAGRPAWMAW